jgi:nucleoside-diphosphate-sugar epimerase
VRVLVAADGGYIGAVLVPFFQQAGHQVDGLDLGLYAGCDLGPAQPGAIRSTPSTCATSPLTNLSATTPWCAWRRCPTTRSGT